jgi:hypothetical protein
MFLRKFLNLLRPKRPTLPELVARVFNESERQFATTFYDSWRSQEQLLVQLGEGDHELYDKNAFFQKAFFYFLAHPIESGDFWILGVDAEDELGMVALDTRTGKIYYAYETFDPVTLTELASNFSEFIGSLRAAGWTAPVAR